MFHPQKFIRILGCIIFTVMILQFSACTNQANDQNTILSECPYMLSEQAQWEYYPQENLFGLEAIAREVGERKTTIIMAFSRRTSAADIDQKILKKSQYVTGSCRYGSFSFEGENCELSEQKHSFYIKLIYDNRIQLQCVSFDREDERDIVYLSDQLQLTYCDFRKKESYAWATQEFSREDGTWGERTERTKDNKVTATCGTTIYTKLAIVTYGNLPPQGTQDDLTLCVYDVAITNTSYNIYGEVTKPGAIRLKFWMDKEGEDAVVENWNAVTLYQKLDGQYVDVTPEDVKVELVYDKGNSIKADLKSNLLELGEGDYRLEVDGCHVDFTLQVQTFTVC